jgi:hypothetical protein
MNDFNLQELQPEQNPVLAVTESTVTHPPAPSKKSRRNVFVIIGVLLICLCMCVGTASLVVGKGVIKIVTEEPKVEIVIDKYMKALADKDASKAYALFSTRAKKNISLADLGKFLEGNYYRVFEGYQSLAIANINLSIVSDPDPDVPQGMVAEVDGMISYADGFTGNFEAVLEKDGEEWRLFSINVTVPPDKFSP